MTSEDGQVEQNTLSARQINQQGTEMVIQEALMAHTEANSITAEKRAEEERYLIWKQNFNPSEEFMTEEQVNNIQLRQIIEHAIRNKIPTSKKSRTDLQNTAFSFLRETAFFKNAKNNRNEIVLEVLNNDLSAMWVIYKQMTEYTEGGYLND